MNYTKSDIDAGVENNKLEFVQNKVLFWLNKFWQFSLFYGDYLGSLHSYKKH